MSNPTIRLDPPGFFILGLLCGMCLCIIAGYCG